MTIVLNHTIVPARDKEEAARFFARIFGLECGETDYFAPVRVNEHFTLLFDSYEADEAFDVHHYAFHVSDAEFDAIFDRVREAGILFGSDSDTPDNGRINRWGGGRGFYFRDPNGHLLELMTVPQ